MPQTLPEEHQAAQALRCFKDRKYLFQRQRTPHLANIVGQNFATCTERSRKSNLCVHMHVAAHLTRREAQGTLGVAASKLSPRKGAVGGGSEACTGIWKAPCASVVSISISVSVSVSVVNINVEACTGFWKAPINKEAIPGMPNACAVCVFAVMGKRIACKALRKQKRRIWQSALC